MNAPNKDVALLVVDDDDVCQMLVDRAIKDLGSKIRTVKAADGIEALELLRSTDNRPAIAQPLIILLDLRMPRMNGLEFLEELRHDPRLHDITVFVLTTSNQEHDIHAAYALNAAGYLVKPDEYEVFKDMVAMLVHYSQHVVPQPSPPIRKSAAQLSGVT